MTALQLAAVAAAMLCVAFAMLHLLARRIDNYGIVDVGWSYAFAALAVYYAVSATGWPVRRTLIAAMACTWSVRLGTHLLQRVARHHPSEDARYQQLRRDWAKRFSLRMFVFFEAQALSVVVLGIVFLIPAQNPAPELHQLEIAGIALWLIALVGEALADGQLAAFKRVPANHGRVCDAGLWRWSRHPNYFFECLVWVAYALFALPSPWGWVGWIAPATILYLLTRVTGIPLAEAQSLQSKGDAYRRYQQVTRAFVPWPPRAPKK